MTGASTLTTAILTMTGAATLTTAILTMTGAAILTTAILTMTGVTQGGWRGGGQYASDAQAAPRRAR